MRLLLSTVVLGLAWFAAVNLVASALAWIGARLLARDTRTCRPDLLVLVRLLPATLALLFVAGVFLPGHLRFEPAESDERVGLLVLALTSVGIVICVRTFVRACHVALIDFRTGRAVRAAAVSRVAGAYEVEDFDGVSLAGVFQPHVLVGVRARTALTADELEVAIAHEQAHRSSRDNLKRCAMFCAPDLFGWSQAAQRLEQRWRALAEWDADARAVAGSEARGVQLASALVKVARLGPGVRSPLASPLWSTFHEPRLLEARVRRLVAGPVCSTSPRSLTRVLVLAISASAALILSMGAVHDIHRATELLIRLLP